MSEIQVEDEVQEERQRKRAKLILFISALLTAVGIAGYVNSIAGYVNSF